MSKPAVIGSLILAIVLAGLAAFLLRPTPPAPTASPILAFRPSDVEEIRIVLPGKVERLIRAGEGWSHLVAGEPEESAWPVSPSNVEGALRLLTAMIGEPIDPGEAPRTGSQAPVIEIDVGSSLGVRTWRLLASPVALGGRRAITVVSPSGEMTHARVEGEIFDALLDTGPLAWREMFALPGVSLDTSRIAMRTQRGLVTLLRSRGQWLMSDPVPAPAHEPAVTDLLQRLAGIRLERFIDEPEADPEAAYGLDNPEAQVRLEREIRRATAGGEVERTIEVRDLTIGDPADLAGELRFARVTRTFRRAAPDATPEVSERIVVIQHASLERIAPQAAVYIDPRTLQRPPEDIGGVEVVTLRSESPEVITSLSRTLDGWQRTIPDSPIILKQEKRLEAFIREMCAAAADSVVIDPPTGSLIGAVGVEFKTLGAAPIAKVTVGAVVEGQGESSVAYIGVRSGKVIRVYKREIPWIEQFIADP